MDPYQSQVAPSLLFEDQHLVVLEKPAGMLSQGDASGEPSLVDWLRVHFGRNYVGLVHRLDRNVSGLMVVAKRTKSAQRLTEALQKDRLVRRYIARVGGVAPERGKLKHELLKDERTNEVRVVRPGTRGAKAAVLRFAKLETFSDGTSLLAIELETGRSHQIRVQLAAAGHPILGDRKYGGATQGGRITRPLLHSAWLSFPHPMSGETMTFASPPPEDFSIPVQSPLRDALNLKVAFERLLPAVHSKTSWGGS